MSKYRHSDKKIKELEEKIKFLNKSLDFSRIMNKNLENNYDEVNKERINYRRIIKYHSLLLILTSLLCQTNGNTDIDKLIKRNIMDFYSAMCKDMMEIPNNDNDVTDNEFDDETEGFDESESDDLWDGAKKCR
jgi:hypothetical protein